MKLSEAIRQGSKLRPQGFNSLFVQNGAGELCSCALGAAYEATFGHAIAADADLELDTAYDELIQAYPALAEHAEEHGFEYDDDTLQWYVIHENDAVQLTREQIADMLEAEGL